MKTNKEKFVISKLNLAVQGALVAMLAVPLVTFAADDDSAALTQPTNSVEIGAGYTPIDSAKFGEYNGLNKQGTKFIGNFSVRGGDAYNAKESEAGNSRWEIKGVDLGTTSREVSGTMSNQGQWDLGFKYDSLRHNISDTYQTPLQGTIGGNSFTLPADFGVIDTNFRNATTLKQGAQELTATQLSAFQKQDVHTDRNNTSFTAGFNFNQQWAIKFDFNRLDQSGAKLMSVATDAADAASGPGGSTWGVEKMMVLMNPTSYKTDTFNLSLNWKGDNSFFNAGLYTSLFTDEYNSLTFPNPFAATGNTGSTTAVPTPGTLATFPINTISTMPSNQFHQFNLNGGYTFTQATKLVGGVSYGRNTQNESYPFAMMQTTPLGVDGATALPMGGGVPPQNSLDALVVTTHADLKLTNQSSKDLMLTAGFKFNQRDNQTASNTYHFIDLGGKNRTAVNTPMSNRKTQLELAADYRINTNNRVHLAYEYEGIRRWCNNDLANLAQGVAPAGYVYATGSCVQVPTSSENKLVANYRLKAGEDVNFNAGFSHAKRISDINPDYYNPMQADVEGFNNTGYRAFFDASRTEDLMKAGVNWQTTEKLSFAVNGRINADMYDDSFLGVQRGSMQSANMDATYSYAENGVVSAYVSMRVRQRDLLSLAGRLPTPTANGYWTNQLVDEDNTIGLAAKQKGLMGGKLEVSSDLTYSLGQSHYSTQTPYSATCSATTSLICGSTPTISSETVSLKITGQYQVDKSSKVALGYMFQQLTSKDYYYNFYQYGYTGTGNLPTNEQAPNYSVNVVTVAYTYLF
jgi:MtrB/PioB family decaheme-associated outer membrane protein